MRGTALITGAASGTGQATVLKPAAGSWSATAAIPGDAAAAHAEMAQIKWQTSPVNAQGFATETEPPQEPTGGSDPMAQDRGVDHQSERRLWSS